MQTYYEIPCTAKVAVPFSRGSTAKVAVPFSRGSTSHALRRKDLACGFLTEHSRSFPESLIIEERLNHK